MMEDQELIDLLDRYYRGQMSASEAAEIEKRLLTDEQFRNAAESHHIATRAIKLVGNRQSVKKILASVPLETPKRVVHKNKPSSTIWKRLIPLTGIAASVAIISVMGTMLAMQSMEKEQTARYIEAVRKVEQRVEQIKESQNLIINNIAETKEKTRPQPGRYAGTGFLISANGYLVTSHHVVKGADSVYIENTHLGSMKATVVYSDASNDVSILRIESEELPHKLPYTIVEGEARLGEDVYTLGFPREDIVFGEGAISALTGYRQNPNSYQVSVPVNPGNSGGPLFNSRGDLVGIISGLQTETSGAAFAIKSSVILRVLEEMPADSLHSSVVLPKTNALKGLPKVEQVNKWKDNVFVVRVYNSK